MPAVIVLIGLALLAAGMVCNALTGRRHPHPRRPSNAPQTRGSSPSVTNPTGIGCLLLLGWVLIAVGVITILTGSAGLYIASHP